MKVGMKYFIALAFIMVASFSVCASAKITTFQTGPFSASVDLGSSCTQSIAEPVQDETLGGDQYTYYEVNVCDVKFGFFRYDKILNATDEFGSEDIIKKDFLAIPGVGEDTIEASSRNINGKPGLVAERSVTGFDHQLKAKYYVSQNSYGTISTYNETMMKSILRTILVNETT